MRLFLLSAALVSLLFPIAAKAEFLAVCGTAKTQATASYGSTVALSMIEPGNTEATSQLALWHDAKGFDVVLNWGQQNQLSLRATGADIMGAEMGADLIHIVVARAGASGLDHFLFSWDDQAVGEVFWSASAPANRGDDEVVMACIKPKP